MNGAIAAFATRILLLAFLKTQAAGIEAAGDEAAMNRSRRQQDGVRQLCTGSRAACAVDGITYVTKMNAAD